MEYELERQVQDLLILLDEKIAQKRYSEAKSIILELRVLRKIQEEERVQYAEKAPEQAKNDTFNSVLGQINGLLHRSNGKNQNRG